MLTIRLQDELGKPVPGGDACFDFKAIEAAEPKGLLHYINPWGDTVFNQVQAADFLVEWERVKPIERAAQDEWLKIRDMAVRCKDEPHLYLWFIGD